MTDPRPSLDAAIEQLRELLLMCREGVFYEDHDLSLDVLVKAERALDRLAALPVSHDPSPGTAIWNHDGVTERVAVVPAKAHPTGGAVYGLALVPLPASSTAEAEQ